MKRKIWICVLLIVCLCLSACGKAGVGEDSPCLVSASVASFHESGGDSQFVLVTLLFDREVSVSEKNQDSLRITIAGNRVREYTMEVGSDEKSVLLTIPVEAVTDGILYIGKAAEDGAVTDICSRDGKYAARDFEVQGSIPSGVSLATVSSAPGQLVKEVVTGWNIRSIAWVALFEDGVLVPVSETMEGEEMDGYAAVHGHEFLIEDEADIAAGIVEVLERNYGGEYGFSCDGSRITVEKSGSSAILDLCIYEYLDVNGQRIKETSAETEPTPDEEPLSESEHDEEGELGAKYKISEEDREPTEEERAFLSKLRTAGLSGQVGEDGTVLYSTLTFTGEAMNETEIYSLRDMEELIRLSFVNTKMKELGLPLSVDGYYGLDMKVFLPLCEVDTADEELNILCETADGGSYILPLSQIAEEDAVCLLALADENGPLGVYGEGEGPFCLVLIRDGQRQTIANLSRILIGTGDPPADPEYWSHDRELYRGSLDIAFTVEVYQEGSEYLGALKSVSFTTAELEDLMRRYPDKVVGGYYGTIGDEDNFIYVGVGGWLDYFQGLDLYWLLTEQAGIGNLSGRAELYDRDGVMYSEIDDLSYLSQAADQPGEYYTMTADGIKITGSIPMLATVKNGAPILKEHAHDGEDYIAYNTMNQNLEALGISTEVGVIKNHNGPFIACLGNRSGYYGGNQVETGNNCVTLRLYLK